MTLIIKYHYTGIRYDVCHLGCHVIILMPSVVMLNVPSVTKLNVVMLNVVFHSAITIILNVSMLNAFMPNFVMLNVTAQ